MESGCPVPETPAYVELLEELKTRIREARIRATLAVNHELLQLYWEIGREIVVRQESERWGSSVIRRLASDLKRTFPDVRGFSTSNIWRMRAFFLAYRARSEKLAPLARVLGGGSLPASIPKLPWSHQVVLVEKLKDPQKRDWYGNAAVVHGWSRRVLEAQIESGLLERQGLAATNFGETLPRQQSDLATELFKDPYHFDFLGLGPRVDERDLERSLLMHIRDFLLEMGVGFSLVGSQYRLEIGGQEYRLDLLFYHFRLRCFVAVELKIGSFKPEHAGKMNFYLAALDDLLRTEEDQASIGLILCKDRNRVVVEYALRGSNHPIGVAKYRLTKSLPKELRGSLPTAEEIGRRLTQEGGG